MRLLGAIDTSSTGWGFNIKTDVKGPRLGDVVIPFRKIRKPLNSIGEFGGTLKRPVIQCLDYNYERVRSFKPRARAERCGLILWEVRSNRGTPAEFDTSNALKVVTRISSQGRGKHAEWIMAVLPPGKSLFASRQIYLHEEERLELRYDGERIVVLSEEMQIPIRGSEKWVHLHIDRDNRSLFRNCERIFRPFAPATAARNAHSIVAKLPPNAVVLVTGTPNPIMSALVYQELLRNPNCKRAYCRINDHPVLWFDKNTPS